jgi:hypothetical protein
MPSPTWTRLVIALSAALAILFALVTGSDINQGALLKVLSVTSSAVVILLLIYDRWLWRMWPLRYLTHRPIVHGTWKATLESGWTDPATGERTAPKDGFVVMHQTYSNITVTMLFDISHSHSLSADICLQNERHLLAFIYRSEAETLAQEGNPPHRGGAALYIATERRVSFEGDYWTERRTKGRVVSNGHSKKIYKSFRDASRGDYK